MSEEEYELEESASYLDEKDLWRMKVGDWEYIVAQKHGVMFGQDVDKNGRHVVVEQPPDVIIEAAKSIIVALFEFLDKSNVKIAPVNEWGVVTLYMDNYPKSTWYNAPWCINYRGRGDVWLSCSKNLAGKFKHV